MARGGDAKFLIGPSGEQLTLAQFIAGAPLENQISAVPSADDRMDAEYYYPKYLRLEGRLADLPTKSIDALSLSIRSGPFGSNLLKTSYIDDGVIVLRPFNIKNATIEEENLVYISEKDCYTQGLSLYQEGDIAFARVGDIRCGIVPDYGKLVTISPNIIMARIDPFQVNPYFLAVFMNTDTGHLQMERGLKVVAQPTITVDTIKSVQVPIISDEQQKEVADIFGASIRKKAESRQLYMEAEGLLLESLGLDGLDLSPQLSYTAMFDEIEATARLDPEYYQPKYAKVIRILEQIGYETIENLSFSIRSGPFGSNLLKTSYVDDGVVVLRPFNIQKSTIERENLVYISEKDCKQQGLTLYNPGDVAFARVGDVRCGVIPDFGRPITISPNIIVAQINQEKINPIFLALFMNSDYGFLQMEQGIKAVAQPTITVSTIKSIKVPLIPIEEQNRIADVFNQSVKAEYEAKQLLETAKQRVEQMILGEDE